MNVTETSLPGVIIIEPTILGDDRGFFLETFRQDQYEEILGKGTRFVQDNHSRSVHGVLRGLHFQERRPQGKLVRCVAGEVFDVAVDIQPESEHFGKWVGVILNAEKKQQIYVPPGFAHGFQVLSESADIEYKCTDYYDPGGESGVMWNDPDIGIEWPLAQALLSQKDSHWPGLRESRCQN